MEASLVEADVGSGGAKKEYLFMLSIRPFFKRKSMIA